MPQARSRGFANGGAPWGVRLWGLAAALLAAPLGIAQTPATYHARADQALQSYLIKYWNGGRQYLRNSYPDTGSLTGYWTYANGWDALMDGVERTGGQQYSGLIESFYLGQNERGWFSGYYDDECWMTLALVRAYDLSHDSKYLNQAAALFADIETGWDTSCCGANPGGLWWDKAHTQKATAANAGAALAGARLYLRTADASYLQFARQAYAFWHNKMVNPTTFQVADHFTPDDTFFWWRFTYNEGLMIGAAVELYDASGDSSYLINAQAIAGFLINNEVTPTAYGNVLYDGSNSGCGGDCHEFKGPACRYLLRLYTRDTSRTRYYDTLHASADALWNLARSAGSTLFAVNWAGPPQTSADQAQDNAACMALSGFAQASGAYPGSGIPLNQYEAENGTLHHIGLEALYGGYTGWGYIAGWNGDGQWIDFNLNLATAGPRILTFRFAAGAGDATRLIYINGADAFPDQRFPGTGAWTNYNSISVSTSLPAGRNTISVIFNSSLGSSNWLNLDNLTVRDDGPLQITSIARLATGSVRLTWNAVPGWTYRVQFRDRVSGGIWNDSGGPITATEPTASADVAIGASGERYYRIVTP